MAGHNDLGKRAPRFPQSAKETGMSTRNRHASGSTLIELLVVIAIIGILVSILLPAVQMAREAARRSGCGNNLKQISLGFQNYESVYGALPPHLVMGPCAGSTAPPQFTMPTGWWTWRVFILPWVEQVPLYNEIDTRADGHAEMSRFAEQTSQNLPVYLCPSDSYAREVFRPTDFWQGPKIGLASSNYFACLGGDGGAQRSWFYPNWDNPSVCDRYAPTNNRLAYNGAFPDANRSISLAGITDGTSQTIAAGERPGDPTRPGPQLGWWALGVGFDAAGNGDSGIDGFEGFFLGNSQDPWAHMNHFWSQHPGGANFTMCDGSVRFILYNINYHTFTALGSRSGAEVIPGF
jgi:prepilin-type N-terminal cleavage/methylation domain-containing protein/prepilin-type processing-associated H-X9-DG protein